jgi:hypothetical protein
VALEPIGADGPLRARSPFAGNAVLDRSGTLAADTRSGLVVDGRSTFGPSPLAAFDPALDGLDGVQIVALSTDPQTGTTTSVTREPFLVCPADVAFADLSPATCPQVRDAGVQLERTVATGADGATLTASDRFVSTDGLAHAVTVRYSHRQAAGPNAYRVPWEPDPSFRARTSGELLPTPPARVSSIELRAEASDSVPGPQNPLGAVTLVPRPDQLRFTGGASFEVTYARRVPASGALQVVQRFAAATGAAELAALVSAHEAAARASAPRVEITSPTLASGFDNAYVLTGRAEGLGAITALDVNGRTVVPAADGAFSVPLELRTGPNPVSVTAVDAAGDRTEAAATISFTPPPASASYTRPTYRRGVILLPVTCRALTGTSCVIRTALSARFKRKIGRRARFKSVTLQRRTIAVPAGSSTVVRLRVSARNRALVRKYRRLRARLELVQAGVTSASGKPARRLYGVTLK